MWVLALKFRLLGLTDRRIFGVSILICILSHSSSSTPTRQYVGKTSSGTKRTEDLIYKGLNTFTLSSMILLESSIKMSSALSQEI